MAYFEIEALKAYHGDCLILHWGESEDARKTALVDGGASRTYDRFLRPRLETLANDAGGTLDLAFAMLSHIDSDHVSGLLDLTSELIDADMEDKAPLVTISDLWHNAFSDTIAGVDAKLKTTQPAALVLSAAIEDSTELDHIFGGASDLVLAGVAQGRRLSRDAERLNIPTNDQNDGKLILRGAVSDPIIVDGLNLSVIGPSEVELRKLRKKWARELKKILKKEGSAAEVASAASGLDRSVHNLASLVILAEFEGLSLLLTGDARGDMILEWLDEGGYLNDESLEIDVLKIPHHGSNRNASVIFFEKVRAKHYIFSGNGKHGNPDPSTLAMLFEARGDEEYTLHLTYSDAEMADHNDFDGRAYRRLMQRYPWARGKIKFPSENSNGLSIRF